METKKNERFKMNELCIVKADWDHTFIGRIIKDENKCVGKVKIYEGEVIASADTDDKLFDKLDAICVMKLNYGLHRNPGVFSLILQKPFFHN